MNIPHPTDPRIVIIGGGFAGLELAKSLANKPFQVILLDKNNHFTFQPLLYQVATGGLEPNSIAYPLRRKFRKAKNVHVRLAEVHELNPHLNVLSTSIGDIQYDYLVIATGSQPNFFGLDKTRLLPLKSVPQALQMRNHVMRQFEKAAVAKSEAERSAYTNFVVVGAGPTGVELAGALGEMKRYVLPKDYPELDFSIMNIHLVEGLDSVLSAMSDKSSVAAKKALESLGVEIHLNTLIKDYDGEQIEVNGQIIPTRNLIWTAGVKPATIEGMEDAISERGRIKVNEYNQVLSYSNIYAIGDVAEMTSDQFPKGYPMLAPVAVQQGQQLGKNFIRKAQDKPMLPFKYLDKGTMATIGRNRAVADIGQLHLKGFFAWLAWMFVHLMTLVGYRNKAVVLVNWIYNYFTYDKALRLIIKRGNNKEEYYQETADME